MGAHRKPLTQDVLPAGAWEVDARGSEVSFQVRHLGISSARGRFTRVQGTLRCEGGTLDVQGSVEVASLETGDRQREELLLSADFFDAERHPRLRFSCSWPAPPIGEPVEIDGELEIRGLARALRLQTNWTLAPDGAAGRLAVWASAEVRRSDYQLRFASASGYGNALIGETVKIGIELAADAVDRPADASAGPPGGAASG